MPLEELEARRQEPKKGPGRPPKPKAPTLETGLELLARGLFALPAILGQGEHWYLTEGESRQIGIQANAAVTSLPSRKVEALTKVVNQWAPWLGLATTLAVCLIARVQHTRMLYVQTAARGPRAPGPAADGAPPSGGNVPGNGAATGTGAAKNRVADVLRESEGPGFEGHS